MGIRPIWSSDGQKIACQAANGIRIWDVKNKNLLLSYFTIDSLEEDLSLAIAWSPDGGQIAYLTLSGHLVVQPVSMMMSDNVTVARNPISWSNDGNSITYINSFDGLVVFDVTQNNETIVFTEFPAPVRYLKWREDDQQVALIVGELSAFEGIDRVYVFDIYLMKLI
jgi:WD40 repeat protein